MIKYFIYSTNNNNTKEKSIKKIKLIILLKVFSFNEKINNLQYKNSIFKLLIYYDEQKKVKEKIIGITNLDKFIEQKNKNLKVNSLYYIIFIFREKSFDYKISENEIKIIVFISIFI